MKKISFKNLFSTVAVSLLLTGCAAQLPELPIDSSTLPGAPLKTRVIQAVSTTPVAGTTTNGDNSQALTFVARDLVAGLAFISGVSPNQISIKAPSVNSKFDWLVQAAMIRNGYSLGNRYGRSQSKQLTTSYLQKGRPDGSLELTAIISIDSILVRRSYILVDGSIQPGTSYLIRGVDRQLIEATALVDIL